MGGKKAEIKIHWDEKLCTTSDTHMSNVLGRGACGCVRARTGGLVLSAAQLNLRFLERKTPREVGSASGRRFTSAQVVLRPPAWHSLKAQIFCVPLFLCLFPHSPRLFFSISSFLTSVLGHVSRRYVAW